MSGWTRGRTRIRSMPLSAVLGRRRDGPRRQSPARSRVPCQGPRVQPLIRRGHRWRGPVIPLRLSEIARITGGRVCDAIDTVGVDTAGVDPLVDGPVVTDSREAADGSLYVARIGEDLDGHRFVAAARSQGAVAALTSRPVADLPSVVVQDVQAAFVSLAHALVDRNTKAVVIGITGS